MLNDSMQLVQSEIYAPDVTSARDALATLQAQCDQLSKNHNSQLLVPPPFNLP